MNATIRFLSASETSTTSEDSEDCQRDAVPSTTGEAFLEVVLPGLGQTKTSADGRLTRVAISARREAVDATFRSRMQEARVSLASEFLQDATASLARLRLERGYSQQQLAAAIGTSQPHIAKIEAGRTALMFDTATRLADALGATLDQLRPLLTPHSNENRHA